MCTSEKELESKGSELRKTSDFYEEKKFAYMIFEHFRATGACEAVQGLSDLFNIP